MKEFPTKDFGLAIYPKLAKMKLMSSSSNNGSDVVVLFQGNRLLMQSVRKLKNGQSLDIQFGGETATTTILNSDMINFKCSGKDCSLSFPLKDKTNEKVVKCPLEECATETNIWKRLKRIVELKKDHQTARQELENKQLRSAIQFLIDLIAEWDTIIYRPYKEVTSLEEDLKKAILLHNETMDREWFNVSR